MPFSYWENDFYKGKDACVIIGAGIVGLSTALEIKKRRPDQAVIVVEQYHPPQGASTKNAGFACFGSVTELMDDLQIMTPTEVTSIVSMRWHGIQKLKERMALKRRKVEMNGGKELFAIGKMVDDSALHVCNKIMLHATGIDDYFKIAENKDFGTLDPFCITMEHEGQLHAMDMYDALHQLALEAGVKFILGHKVSHIHQDDHHLEIEGNIKLDFDKLFICTNGFTKFFLPELDVVPARNHVLITNELPDMPWQGVYHYDKGYYYFRKVGRRILLGGARNLDPETESTHSFEYNAAIQQELLRFLHEVVIPNQKVAIAQWWTGILGIGSSKYPILEKVSDHIFIGVRLGGMGVAIGSHLGESLAALAFGD